MTTAQMHEFARFGAESRLKAIAEERQAILQVFPELANGSAPTRQASPAASARKRNAMSRAQRKAVGERMKAYWAKRRGEKTGRAADTQSASDGAATPANQPSKRKGMSADARKAQGERMRAYWAARRAEKGGEQAEAGAGSSGKRKGSRKAVRREARKK